LNLSELVLIFLQDTDICHAWDVDTFAETIDALLPAFGTEWAVLYANGICDGAWRVDADAPHEDLVPLPYGQGMLPGNPACLPFYCDLFALRDHAGVHHTQHIINLIPGRCDLKNASTSFCCRELNGETVMPVRAAFGGMAMYWMGLFRGNDFAQNGQHCHYESAPGNPCEHVPLGLCLWEKGIKQLVAARWTVDCEGCTGPVQDTPQRIKCVVGNENVASSKT
jgi:hypothetical protein